MLFDLLVPQKILCGPGAVGRLGDEAALLGKRALLVTGRHSLQAGGMIDRVMSPLAASQIEIQAWNKVAPEPTLDILTAGLAAARQMKAELIIGVGGGSALDVAKAMAGLYHCEGQVCDYYQGRPVDKAGLPWIAVPTTAGSGAEATRNAVLSDTAQGSKKSIRDDGWMATVAIVDPVLTMTMSQKQTAISGMDALTHALEAYTSRWSNPFSSPLACESAILICRNLYSAYRKGRERDVREQMSMSSLMAGIALNNARLGAVHGLAHPVGSRYHLPHGLVCGILLPYVMEYNLHISVIKYAALARLLDLAKPDTLDEESARQLVRFVQALRRRLEIPDKLGACGLVAADIPALAEASLTSESLAANPRSVFYNDLVNILEANL
jgi:alcohol dehydrogenase class IV